MRYLFPHEPRINWKGNSPPMSVHPPKLNPVRERQRFSNFPFGFRWNRNSCSFDTVVTVVIHLLAKLSPEQLAVVANEMAEFQTFRKLSLLGNLNDGSAWHVEKEGLRRRIYDTTEVITLEDIWKRLFPVQDINSSLLVSHSQHIRCTSNQCLLLFTNFQTNYSLDVMEHDGRFYQSIQHWLEVKCNVTNRMIMCQTCGEAAFRSRILLPLPEILYLHFYNSKDCFYKCIDVDAHLTIHGQNYQLHGVGYGSGSHFRARFSHSDHNTYEYEGMNELASGEFAVRCRLVNNQSKFPFLLPGRYFAQFAIYVKRR